ncbi:2-aminoethylphosphonate ABC transporter substrate-binding protein [Streptomyces sp. NPDC020800]|uniref:2-aminoethylphosphonate ABC transporter substrate-binding protein n=1 Tax=Streptomyces sp. NPDC020800 TaxID=3365092 RepID=UPI00379C7261
MTATMAGCAGTSTKTSSAGSGSVTVYSADGLHDGNSSWFQTQFDAFEKQTGIHVNYVEGGSGDVVNRLERERSNTQADVLVTLPPFIQRADKDQLLESYTPAAAEKIPSALKSTDGRYTALVNNFVDMIYNRRSKAPATFDQLLDPKYKNKIQYSTPGQAGDGTALLLNVIHAYGSVDKGMAFLKKLQANNVGPSSSTGKLTPKVNTGELAVANGDVQMNLGQEVQNPNIKIFFPAGPDGERYTFAIPYEIGLVAKAPRSANGKKLIDFLLSASAQKSVSKLSYGLPVRNDVHPTDANYTAFLMQLNAAKIWTPDWNSVLDQLNTLVAKYQSATGS